MTTYHVTDPDDPTYSKDYPEIVAGFRPAHLLAVPFVSQLEEGANKFNNDCGAACGVMLLRAYKRNTTISVDDFYKRCNPEGDKYLSATQIKNALASDNLGTTWQIGLNLDSLFGILQEGKPLIALLNYGVLVDAGLTEKKTFKGAHFAVVVGMDIKYVYTHDPYYTQKNGEASLYPISNFMESWSSCAVQNNPNNAALIPNYSLYAAQDQPADVLYRIKVTANGLNIRSGPSANFLDIGDLKKDDERNIYKEQNGWGEIEPDHWISLAYTIKI